MEELQTIKDVEKAKRQFVKLGKEIDRVKGADAYQQTSAEIRRLERNAKELRDQLLDYLERNVKASKDGKNLIRRLELDVDALNGIWQYRSPAAEGWTKKLTVTKVLP